MLENIIVLKCVSVIRNDLNMITIFHGLSKIIGQLSATAKLWKEMAKRKVKICNKSDCRYGILNNSYDRVIEGSISTNWFRPILFWLEPGKMSVHVVLSRVM